MRTLNTNFLPFPELVTSRLRLRRITANDLDELFSYRSSPSVMKYIKRPIAKSTEDALALIKKIDDALEASSGITWGIAELDTNHLLGTIGFWRIEHENFRAEIGYLLNEDFHGKGLMKEAIGKVVEFGFTKMNLHSIEGRVDPENLASLKLLEKCGFVKEGFFKENYFFDGKFEDSVVYSRLNTGSKAGTN